MKSDTLIKFNWEGILSYSSYDCKKAIKLLSQIITNNYGIKDYKVIESMRLGIKDCWLIRPVEFLMNGSTTNEKCVYLHLATKRNWLDYTETGNTSLPIYIVDQFYSIESLQTNPLFNIYNETIDFKY